MSTCHILLGNDTTNQTQFVSKVTSVVASDTFSKAVPTDCGDIFVIL